MTGGGEGTSGDEKQLAERGRIRANPGERWRSNSRATRERERDLK